MAVTAEAEYVIRTAFRSSSQAENAAFIHESAINRLCQCHAARMPTLAHDDYAPDVHAEADIEETAIAMIHAGIMCELPEFPAKWKLNGKIIMEKAS